MIYNKPMVGPDLGYPGKRRVYTFEISHCKGKPYASEIQSLLMAENFSMTYHYHNLFLVITPAG